MRKTGLILVALLLIIESLFNLTSCIMAVKAQDLMEGVEPRDVAFGEIDQGNALATDFAIRLFNNINDN